MEFHCKNNTIRSTWTSRKNSQARRRIRINQQCSKSFDFQDTENPIGEPENPTEETPETPTNSTLYFPPINSENWDTATPESLGWHTENIDVLDEFLVQSGTKAFIILSKGKIILEKYYNNSEASDNLPWNSAGKTLTAFFILQAAENNLIHLDDPTTSYLGVGWTNMTPEQEQNITIRHQMTMTSGGDFTVENTSCTDPECLNYLNVQALSQFKAIPKGS